MIPWMATEKRYIPLGLYPNRRVVSIEISGKSLVSGASLLHCSKLSQT